MSDHHAAMCPHIVCWPQSLRIAVNQVSSNSWANFLGCSASSVKTLPFDLCSHCLHVVSYTAFRCGPSGLQLDDDPLNPTIVREAPDGVLEAIQTGERVGLRNDISRCGFFAAFACFGAPD